MQREEDRGPTSRPREICTAGHGGRRWDTGPPPPSTLPIHVLGSENLLPGRPGESHSSGGKVPTPGSLVSSEETSRCLKLLREISNTNNAAGPLVHLPALLAWESQQSHHQICTCFVDVIVELGFQWLLRLEAKYLTKISIEQEMRVAAPNPIPRFEKLSST